MLPVYRPPDSSTSGARYQRVTTYSVKAWDREESDSRARPKSHIFRLQSEFTRRLEGLRSRCRMWAAWMTLRAHRVW
jgi:hypothetical protein